MAIESMTGFARSEAITSDGTVLVCEIRSVNARSIDVRVRLPVSYDRLEIPVRQLVQKSVTRGNLQISISCQEVEKVSTITINEPLLIRLLAVAQRVNDQYQIAMPSIGELFSLRGVIEPSLPEKGEELDVEILAVLEKSIIELKCSRSREGENLVGFLSAHLSRIAHLVTVARADPSRTPSAISMKLRVQLGLLMETLQGVDEQRLAMEAALLATRVDIEEELDRLDGHIDGARQLLEGHGPVGRKLDFLAQEFSREVNTLCAKSNSSTITTIGLELKAVVDQFREQVQNLE